LFSLLLLGSKLNAKNVPAHNRIFQELRCNNSKPSLKKSSRLVLFTTLSCGMNPDKRHSSQVDTNASSTSAENSSYDRMINRLCRNGLQALDVGGSGDCFFRAISHQYYGTSEFHIAVRQAGVSFLEQHAELFVESISEDSSKSYLKRMATPGTWCDNIIIQAVANQLNCVIHIIESRLSCPEGTTITPPPANKNQRVLFVVFIEDLHYVSTEPHTINKNALTYLKLKLSESHEQHQKRLQNRRDNRQRKRKQQQNPENIVKKACNNQPEGNCTITQKQYLLNFDAEKNGDIHKQSWAKENITKFHNSNNYAIYQSKICFEAWPLRVAPKCLQNYKCSRCSREKESPKKFSKEDLMIPSPVPSELSGLTQIEELLIAKALLIMHIYIKPGGQRGYSGHTINLPQDVSELAHLLPRYPKDLSIILVKVKGKGNFVKNLSVRRQVVSDAIH